MATLQDEVQRKEEESVEAEAIRREYEARDQNNQGVWGNAGQAAEAAEAYARAETAEKAAAAHDAAAEAAGAVAYRIDNAADKA